MRKKHSPYYAFMQPYFERGNEAEIAMAKLLYRKQYKAAWRKTHRKTVKEITVAWNKEEYTELKEAAKTHKESITKFIKRATVGYMNKTYVVPNSDTIHKALVTLTLCYNRLEELLEEEKLSNNKEKELKETIEALEKDIRIALLSPKTIEQTIQDCLIQHPNNRNHLLTYIQTLKL